MRLLPIYLVIGLVGWAAVVRAQTNDRLTPIQREIEKQRQRLDSSEAEDRRDALMRLANMHRPDASRAAAAGLNDVVPAVRVAAAHAIVWLPSEEAATLLLPLLQDKLEFIRREVAYALGKTRARSAIPALSNLLATDKQVSVRAAAAIALGQIGDDAAAPALIQVLTPTSTGKKKSKGRPDPFVLRASARALGQLRARAAVSTLTATLSSDTNDPDLRREAATALGFIGDPSAIPALRAAFHSDDPYLSQAAGQALRQMHVSAKN